MLKRVLLVVAAAMVSLPAAPRAAEEPAGLWVGTTNVPDQGADQVTLAITKIGDGYGGTMSDSLNIVAKEALRDVRFADSVLSFGFTLTDGTLMKMTLTLSGDKMAGEWETPDGEIGAIAFERKKA
ncbi:MAG: hypothetical protein MUE61_02405 [Vicinamibacterales bacterium]|jgi:hypothetical protein|nr:hypothetical protein [Vicinamibacterales bacterium]